MPSRGRWPASLVVAMAVLAAALLRVPSLFHPLWLDEILSWSMLPQIKQPSDVFTQLHNDNNHHLNTLWMWWCGRDASASQYHLLSYLAGLAAIPLAAAIGARWGERVAIASAWLTAAQGMWAIYSTEARGYSMASCAVLLVWWAATLDADHRRWWAALLVQLGAAIGLIAHLSFATWLIGLALSRALALGLGWRCRHAPEPDESRPMWRALLTLLNDGWRWAVLPAAVAAGLYYYDVRHYTYLADSGVPLEELVPAVIAFPVDGTDWSWWTLFVGLAYHGVAILAGIWLCRERDWNGMIVFIAGFGVPLIVGAIRSELLFPRYFFTTEVLFTTPFCLGIYLLWSRYEAARSSPGVVGTALICLAVGLQNLSASIQMALPARCMYVNELKRIVRDSPRNPIVLGTDQEELLAVELDYYRRFLPNHLKILIARAGRYPPQGVDWYIMHGIILGDRPPPPELLPDERGNVYQRVTGLTGSRFVGWKWYVYQRTNAKTQPPSLRRR